MPLAKQKNQPSRSGPRDGWHSNQNLQRTGSAHCKT
jgi:hypothetical protein